MAQFVDRATLHLQAGDGGHGCASVHREKFKPLGGPDGGNGGHGGDIVLEVSTQVHTLLDFQYRPHVKAGRGGNGAGDWRNGARGEDLVLEVPVGTVVRDEDGEVLADLTVPGTRFIAAEGGYGGLGNAALATAKRKAPGFALKGEPGEAHDLILELKSMADVGLVGFPSAGKSSLISVLSAAKPKIADYPFTTLAPNLGVVNVGHDTFTIADVPGLIPGASEGKGLGLDFLRHIERTAVLAHIVDVATMEPGRDPISDIEALEHELDSYAGALDMDSGLGDLRERPRLVVTRSNRHMVAQVVDDTIGHTLCAASTLEEAAKGVEGHKVGAAHKVGELIAERAKALGIEAVVFDRGGNKYHGRVAAVAEGAREGGLKL